MSEEGQFWIISDVLWALALGSLVTCLVYWRILVARRAEEATKQRRPSVSTSRPHEADTTEASPPAPKEDLAPAAATLSREDDGQAAIAAVQQQQRALSSNALSRPSVASAAAADSYHAEVSAVGLRDGSACNPSSSSSSLCAMSLSSSVSLLPPTVSSMYDAIPARLIVAPRQPSHVLLTDTSPSGAAASFGAEPTSSEQQSTVPSPTCGRVIGAINLAAVTVEAVEVEGAVALRITRSDRSAPVFVELEKMRSNIFGRRIASAASSTASLPPPNWPFVIVVFTSERDRHRWLQLMQAHRDGRSAQTRALHQLYGTLTRSILTNHDDAAAALCARWVIANENRIVSTWSALVHKRLADVQLSASSLPPILALDRYPPRFMVKTVDISATTSSATTSSSSSSQAAAFSLPVLRNIRRCVMADRTSTTAAPGEINLEGNISWEDGFSIRGELITSSFGNFAVDVRIHSLHFPGLLVSLDPAPSADIWVALPQGGLDASGGSVEVDVSVWTHSSQVVPNAIAGSMEPIECAVAQSVRMALFESLTFPHYWRAAEGTSGDLDRSSCYSSTYEEAKRKECMLACRAEVYGSIVGILLDAHWRGARAEFEVGRQASLRVAEASVIANSRAVAQSWLIQQEQQQQEPTAARLGTTASTTNGMGAEESLVSLVLAEDEDDEDKEVETHPDRALPSDALAATTMPSSSVLGFALDGAVSSDSDSSIEAADAKTSTTTAPDVLDDVAGGAEHVVEHRAIVAPSSVPRLDLRSVVPIDDSTFDPPTPVEHAPEEMASPPPAAPSGTAVVLSEVPSSAVIAPVNYYDTSSSVMDVSAVQQDGGVVHRHEIRLVVPTSAAASTMSEDSANGDDPLGPHRFLKQRMDELRGAAVLDASLSLHIPRHLIELAEVEVEAMINDDKSSRLELVMTYDVHFTRRRRLGTFEEGLASCRFLHTLAQLKVLEAERVQKERLRMEEEAGHEATPGHTRPPLSSARSLAHDKTPALETMDDTSSASQPAASSHELILNSAVVIVPALNIPLEQVAFNDELRGALVLDASLAMRLPRSKVNVVELRARHGTTTIPEGSEQMSSTLDVIFAVQRDHRRTSLPLSSLESKQKNLAECPFTQARSVLSTMSSSLEKTDNSKPNVNTSASSMPSFVDTTTPSCNMRQPVARGDGDYHDVRFQKVITLDAAQGPLTCGWSKILQDHADDLSVALVLDATLALHVPRSHVELAQVTISRDDQDLLATFALDTSANLHRGSSSHNSSSASNVAEKILRSSFLQTASLIRSATRLPAPKTPTREGEDGEGLVYLPPTLPSVVQRLNTPRNHSA